jgi:hypothetical protein
MAFHFRRGYQFPLTRTEGLNLAKGQPNFFAQPILAVTARALQPARFIKSFYGTLVP